MSNAYAAANRVWTLDSTGSLWTNTFGTKPSETNGPKYVTRIVYVPSTTDDDLVFQDTGASTAIALKAGASDASPVTVDFSAENGGLGRRFHSLKVSTIDGGTAYLYVA